MKKTKLWGILSRILGSRTLLIYLGAWLLLFAVTPGETSVMEILGGFSPRESRGLNILGIMRWNLCVLPPVAVSILFAGEETGLLRSYTLIRAKCLRDWFLLRFLGIAAANLVYLTLFAVLWEICAGTGDWGRRGFPLFSAVFFLHTLLMSLISAALCVGSRGAHLPVIFYLTVEGMLVVIGNIFPQAAPWLPPYWGMFRQVQQYVF